jgi:3',5'-cyclic-nucleotide phosphodiesterase
LTALELYAIFIAAIAHDVGHPGLDNRCLAASGDPFGVLFKEFGAINEFRHCAILIEVVAYPRANIFHAIDETDRRILWGYISKVIIATDPAQHTKMIHLGNDLLDEGMINLTNSAQRLLALRLLMKVADIAHTLRTFDIAQQWRGLQQEELLRQAAFEAERGIEYQGQVNELSTETNVEAEVLFIENSCMPLLLLVARIFPELDEFTEIAREMIVRWRGGGKKADGLVKGARGSGRTVAIV